MYRAMRTGGDRQPLPRSITVYASPKISRFGKLVWWAHILEQNQAWHKIVQRSLRDTGRQAVHLDEIDLGRRVPEKDVSALLTGV